MSSNDPRKNPGGQPPSDEQTTDVKTGDREELKKVAESLAKEKQRIPSAADAFERTHAVSDDDRRALAKLAEELQGKKPAPPPRRPDDTGAVTAEKRAELARLADDMRRQSGETKSPISEDPFEQTHAVSDKEKEELRKLAEDLKRQSGERKGPIDPFERPKK